MLAARAGHLKNLAFIKFVTKLRLAFKIKVILGAQQSFRNG
jgi:hypothetical protein